MVRSKMIIRIEKKKLRDNATIKEAQKHLNHRVLFNSDTSAHTLFFSRRVLIDGSNNFSLLPLVPNFPLSIESHDPRKSQE